LFGRGFVENTLDDNLIAAQEQNHDLAASLGIRVGVFNRSANDGTITRFGWKAQNKSLLMFAGEAYNVEQGVTNELFPDERETDLSFQYNGLPQDSTNLTNSIYSGSDASDYSSDILNFGAFIRLAAAPAPAPDTASTVRGRQVFGAPNPTDFNVRNHGPEFDGLTADSPASASSFSPGDCSARIRCGNVAVTTSF
jgi:CxxC motif-containing protein (DUF1111 family)